MIHADAVCAEVAKSQYEVPAFRSLREQQTEDHASVLFPYLINEKEFSRINAVLGSGPHRNSSSCSAYIRYVDIGRLWLSKLAVGLA
jgi:hypothetical protein